MRLRFVVLMQPFSPQPDGRRRPHLLIQPSPRRTRHHCANWTDAESQYRALTQQNPENARFWYRLSVSARHVKHYDVALDAMQKAKTLGTGKGLPAFIADYEIATIYAAMGDSKQALASLKASATVDSLNPDRLATDEGWSSLRENQQFIALSKQVRHNAAPCEDGEFRQFDFWVGGWDVAPAAGGVQQGTSHVAKEMGGCVIWENWASVGEPLFRKKLQHLEREPQALGTVLGRQCGGRHLLSRRTQSGVMDYWTDDVPQPTGGSLLRHLQFFNLGPDKVRQFSQGSNDGGKTWHVEYRLHLHAAPRRIFKNQRFLIARISQSQCEEVAVDD